MGNEIVSKAMSWTEHFMQDQDRVYMRVLLGKLKELYQKKAIGRPLPHLVLCYFHLIAMPLKDQSYSELGSLPEVVFC